MPLQHLDAESQSAMKLANVIAHEFELEYVGTEHILLALLRQNTGLAAKILHACKVNEHNARAAVEELLESAKEDTWVFGRLPGSPHFRNVVALAIDEATQLESPEIRTEHLLLALLREKGSTAQRVLARLGVKLESCREAILRHLGKSHPKQTKKGEGK